MPTLYVENVPEDLYEAVRSQAKGHRRSISAEVLALLAENVATPAELARREELVRVARKIRAERTPVKGPFATSEEMQREDRGR
jgi:plasmid stability protein